MFGLTFQLDQFHLVLGLKEKELFHYLHFQELIILKLKNHFYNKILLQVLHHLFQNHVNIF